MKCKPITLSQFFDYNYPDGHYAVWKTDKTPVEGSFLYGFSGVVVEWNLNGGFKNYPEWMDETSDNDMSIVVLQELPNVEQLETGEF
jgi:hypothetical protein